MKTVDFSETVAVCDLKVGRSGQLNEYISLPLVISRPPMKWF